MNKFYNETLHKLETAINELEIEADYSIQRIEVVIDLIVNCLSEVKEYILKSGFKNIEEEIYFFKHQKPIILSKLIYYNAIYKIETKKPNETKSAKKHLNAELKKLKRFFDNNLEFYKYYRANNTFMDDQLFVRGKYDIKLNLDTIYFETDKTFSTVADYKAAKILANDLIRLYIEDQVSTRNPRTRSNVSKLNWTGNKASLTELIYALHAYGVVDNGNTDIKVIAKIFENIFNIDLGV